MAKNFMVSIRLRQNSESKYKIRWVDKNNIPCPKYASTNVSISSCFTDRGLCIDGCSCPFCYENSEILSSKRNNIVCEEWKPKVEEMKEIKNEVKRFSYAEVLKGVAKSMQELNSLNETKSNLELCSYAEKHGVCNLPERQCKFLHGDVCQLCGKASLHPFNIEKRNLHIQKCVEQIENGLESMFLIQRSENMICGICFEVVYQKEIKEQRFAILPNCNHCFCLDCMREWRKSRHFSAKIVRGCPNCRIISDFIFPCNFWVDTKEEKEKLLEYYKNVLSNIHCKYFKRGAGKCPFGNKCFYLHAFPNGKKTDVGPPRRRRRRHYHHNHEALHGFQEFFDEFLSNENQEDILNSYNLHNILGFFSDSDYSDEFYDSSD